VDAACLGPSRQGVQRMRLQSSRAKLLVGAILVLLAALVITPVVSRQSETVYAPNSPEATVPGFFRLLEQGQLDGAFAQTTMTIAPVSFRRHCATWHNTSHRVTLVETRTYGTYRTVTVAIQYFAGGAVGLPERSTQATVGLVRESGAWHICDWVDVPDVLNAHYVARRSLESARAIGERPAYGQRDLGILAIDQHACHIPVPSAAERIHGPGQRIPDRCGSIHTLKEGGDDGVSLV
jgi:hypothetical protein